VDVDRRVKVDLDEDEIKVAIISYLKALGFNALDEDIDLSHDKSNASGFAAGVKCVALCTDIK
jgi:hypothetical protein